MNLAFPIGACCALAALCAGCSRQPGAADASSYIPADTVLLGELHLDSIRAAPLYSALPPAVRSLLDPLRAASDATLASNGKDLLLIARGDFQKAPAGMALAAPGIALAGSEQAIHAAIVQHKSGGGGAAILLARASAMAAGKPIWVIAQGGVTLPLSGNAGNLNRFLQSVDYAVITAALESEAQLTASGVCRSPDAARQLEETMRGFLSLAAAGSAKDENVRTLLNTVQIERQEQTVRASLKVAPAQLDKLLSLFAR